MSNLHQVFWGQGTMLTPQHLQQQDLGHAALAHYLYDRVRPHGWGLRRLELREAGFEAGWFEVCACEWITRDGCVVRGGSEVAQPNASIAARNLGLAVQGRTRPVSVYLALDKDSRLREGDTAQPAPPFAGRGMLPGRFTLSPRQVEDRYDAEAAQADLAFVMATALVVCDADEAFDALQQSAEMIKVAELAAMGQGGIRLVADYIPPVIETAASATLARWLKNARDLLVNKAVQFSTLKRQRGAKGTVSSAQDLSRVVILSALSRYIPLFQHMLEEPGTHPAQIYLLLRTVIGELSAFSEDVDFSGAEAPGKPGLPPYEHQNIAATVGAAISLVERLLRQLAASPESGIRLIHDGDLYKAQLPAEIFEGQRNRYYLVLDTPARGNALWAQLQATGKISAVEDMGKIRQAAVFGLRIEPLPVAPEDLPQRGGNLSYFQIDTRDPVWASIRARQNIAVYCSLAPTDTTITLVTVKADA